MTTEVILVDKNDQPIGTMDKMEAHVKGELHRAFSVFIFNSQNEVLIHQRAAEKYHGAGLWTNACCSHPIPNHETLECAQRRLIEEMGMDCKLEKIFDFTYRAEVENGLIENEFDHVFIGYSDAVPYPDATEVQDWKWIAIANLLKDLENNPKRYTTWFKIALPFVLKNVDISEEA